MARLWTSGGESGALLSERVRELGTGTITFDTSVTRSGARSYKYDSGASSIAVTANFDVTAVDATTYYARVYRRFDVAPGATVSCLVLGPSSEYVRLRLTNTGVVQAWNTTVQIGSDGPTIAFNDGIWHKLEISMRYSAAGDETYELRWNDVVVHSGSGAITAASAWQVAFGLGGGVGANVIWYADDCALNDSTGASQNSWCGEGKVVNLIPTSDSARAALWTGGVGGTTSLFDAVNNIPPIGTATETDLTQIEHAGAAAGTTDAYDANMTTYTAAGIGAADTIMVVENLMVTGEDISTGTKLLNVQAVSNPAISVSANFNVGSAAVGTFPTNWNAARSGVVSYLPSVTLATAPVLRVIRPETAARRASVCYMAMVVEYQAVAAQRSIIVRQAVNRASTY